MAKTLNSALSSIYDRFVFTGSTRSEFYYTNGIGGDDAQVTALQLTTLKNVDDEAVLTTDSSQDASFANDVKLLSDASVLNFGAHNDVKLTHVADTGLLLTQSGVGTIPVLQIRDSGLTISSSTNGQLDIDADTELELGSATIDINATTACEIDNTNTTNGVKIGVNTSGGKVFIGNGTSETTVNDNLTVTGTTALNDDITIPHGKKIIFDSADTYIYANTDDPEDLYMKADADILLIPDGNVGIGTATPDTILNISSTSTTTVGIDSWSGTTATSASYLDFKRSRGTSEDSFTVVAAGDDLGVIRFYGADGNSFSQAASILCEATGTINDGDVPGELSFWTTYSGGSGAAPARRMTIGGSSTNPKIGIGTDSPVSELHIQRQATTGAVPLNLLTLGLSEVSDVDTVAGEGPAISFHVAETGGYEAYSSGKIAVVRESNTDADSEASMTFWTSANDAAATEKMRIKSDGKVGIGMTPDTAFNVKGGDSSGIRLYDADGTTVLAKLEADADSDAVLTLNTSGEVTDIVLNAQADGNSYINTGNFGIGTAAPADRLEVAHESSNCGLSIDSAATSDSSLIFRKDGDAYWEMKNNHSATNRITMTPIGAGAGCYIDQGGTVWVTLSDERIKENIVDLDKGLDTVLAMKPRRFNYIKSYGGLEDVGFVAQELQSVFSEAVDGEESNYTPGENGEKGVGAEMGVCGDKIIPVLVKAIQELSAKVTALENA